MARLARYPDEVVKQAIGFSNMLDDALSFAHSAYEGSPRPLPPEPDLSGTSPAPAPRPLPRDVNADLRRRFGPTQRYDDDF
ncbi:MAG: hypothetical protein WD271_15420 [Acidimicrobiia bacterium]